MDITPLISLVLALLEQVVPQLSGANAQLIAKIIQGLEIIVPILIKEFKDLVPMVQNVIAVLKNNNQVTQDQWNALNTMELKIDADFEAAATDALNEDKS